MPPHYGKVLPKRRVDLGFTNAGVCRRREKLYHHLKFYMTSVHSYPEINYRVNFLNVYVFYIIKFANVNKGLEGDLNKKLYPFC